MHKMRLLPVALFISIHTAPPTMAELPGGPQVIIEAGSRFTLTCSASGWPAPHIHVGEPPLGCMYS